MIEREEFERALVEAMLATDPVLRTVQSPLAAALMGVVLIRAFINIDKRPGLKRWLLDFIEAETTEDFISRQQFTGGGN